MNAEEPTQANPLESPLHVDGNIVNPPIEASAVVGPIHATNVVPPDYSYRCPECQWGTKDIRYEQHACPGPSETPRR